MEGYEVFCMKGFGSRSLCLLLVIGIFLLCIPTAEAKMAVPDLTEYIRSAPERRFVQSMLSYHLTENTRVQETLKSGHSALFLFEGCSDNMSDDTLSDISYYRVSGVCLALRLNPAGEPEVVYFNGNCSTLPDRPLEYGAWELEEVGIVGPATICDGTYDLYSVYHAGAYEALHMRMSFEDETIPAVYMTPEGYVTSRATYINIHTRTVNHILQEAMWSAGCLLVGYNDFPDFSNLIRQTYYQSYETFEKDKYVGTITVNRLMLRQQMYDLYENREAVDLLLTSSRCEDPAIYLQRCGAPQTLPEEKTVQAVSGVSLMSLPCSGDTDSRSVAVLHLDQGDKMDICASVVNTEGEIWYEVQLLGGNCYVKAESVQDVPKHWLIRLYEYIFHPSK